MAVNIFKKAKAYRKVHPRVSFQDAIQAVAKKKTVSGVKRKVAGKKTTVGAKRKRSPAKRVAGVTKTTVKRVVKVSGKKSAIGSLTTGKRIIANINKLENQRKKLNTKIEKDFLSLIINKEHDKLDALSARLKHR